MSVGAVIRQVATLRGTYRSWCERLAAAPGAASLDHNDLHPRNMLRARLDRPDTVRFYDWGDAVIAHPFAAMLVPLTWTQRRLAVTFNAPDLARNCDTYLHVFSDLGPTPAPSVRSLTAQIHCLPSGRGHPVGEVRLRYRRAGGGFADVALEHVVADDLVAGLPVRECRHVVSVPRPRTHHRADRASPGLSFGVGLAVPDVRCSRPTRWRSPAMITSMPNRN